MLLLRGQRRGERGVGRGEEPRCVGVVERLRRRLREQGRRREWVGIGGLRTGGVGVGRGQVHGERSVEGRGRSYVGVM